MSFPNPLDSSSLVGYSEELEHLSKLFRARRLPPIMLFHGKEGIGKTLFAAKLCSYLVCREKKSCGLCESCLSLKQNKHPSVFFLDNKNELISVEETAQIKAHLLTASSHEESPRVVFVRDVERLSEKSTNKLLTSLEDLPQNAYVFFTTGRRYSLLPTLRSRAVAYFLKPLPLDQGVVLVRSLLQREGLFSAELESEIQFLLEESGGSIARVLSVLKKDGLSVWELSDLFHKNFSEKSYLPVYELVETLKKDQNVSLEDCLTAGEIALNKAYKDLACKPSLSEASGILLSELDKKREILASLKETVLDKKIKLNKTLILETILLAS